MYWINIFFIKISGYIDLCIKKYIISFKKINFRTSLIFSIYEKKNGKKIKSETETETETSYETVQFLFIFIYMINMF